MSPMMTHIDAGGSGRVGDVDELLLRALAQPAMYGGGPVAVHETHASWVFVAGERAYKVKKPVTLAFLDYGTLARRLAACREEVRVNRELAPDVYVGVRAIVRTAGGFALADEHAAGAVEYAVEMRSFDEAETLAGLIAAGTLTRERVRAVARRLAAFHRAAPVVDGGGPREVLDMWLANVRELADVSRALAWRVDLMEGFGTAFVAAHEGEIERRGLAGLVRDGHGDLRCEHVLAREPVRVVDRVEFDPALRRTDVACDLAFLTMDLEALGQRWAADELVGAYRSEGVDPGSEALRSFYAAHRALVRAKVALIAASGQQGDPAEGLLEQAAARWALGERLCWRARAPLALLVCGPAASGKSTLAAELARRSGMALVSSDIVRKSAAGLAASERAAPEHYSERFTRLTYQRLGRDARLALARRHGVIVDATCRARADRALLLGELTGRGLTRVAVRCEVPIDLAIARAAQRMGDAARISDATPEVVAEQYRAFEALEELPAGSVLELDTTRPLDAQVAEVTRAVDGAVLCHSRASVLYTDQSRLAES
jgi:aminoglycoside phosphotransferase family enzyme/adenylate kinase family enzyme